MREELNQYLDSTTSMASALGLAALFSMSLIGALGLCSAASNFKGVRKALLGCGALASVGLAIGSFMMMTHLSNLNDERAEQYHASLSTTLKKQYKIEDTSLLTKNDVEVDKVESWASDLQEGNWRDRPHIQVLLDSGESAIYEVGFDGDDLKLYPTTNTQPDPESIRR